MKPSVAIALIIAGLLLVAMPPISDYLWRQDALRVVQMTGKSNVNVDGQMEQPYRIGCFIAGSILLVVAVVGSFSGRHVKLVGSERDFA